MIIQPRVKENQGFGQWAELPNLCRGVKAYLCSATEPVEVDYRPGLQKLCETIGYSRQKSFSRTGHLFERSRQDVVHLDVSILRIAAEEAALVADGVIELVSSIDVGNPWVVGAPGTLFSVVARKHPAPLPGGAWLIALGLTAESAGEQVVSAYSGGTCIRQATTLSLACPFGPQDYFLLEREAIR